MAAEHHVGVADDDEWAEEEENEQVDGVDLGVGLGRPAIAALVLLVMLQVLRFLWRVGHMMNQTITLTLINRTTLFNKI